MDEIARQQYLKIMGVSVWQSKYAMPQTEVIAPTEVAPIVEEAPSPEILLPVEPVTPAPQSEVLVADGWQDLQNNIQSCQRCELHQHRQQALMGEGNQQADIVFIGEAPDDVDDKAGQLFAGQAGQLLDAMLKAIGLDRQSIYLLNMLKCKLPESREPHTSELLCCDDYLQQQINLLQPKLIYAMGNAVQELLLTQQPLAAMRRRAHHYNGIPVIVSLSPQQLLKSPEDKRKAWQDLLQLKKTLASFSDGD